MTLERVEIGDCVLYLGDCLEGMAQLDSNTVDAIVTDPPYELGFMGKQWDSTGIAYNVNVWSNALRLAKPGAHLMAFGGTRTYHRLACAIEDAGFEVRDMVEWVYGSGFPKSLNIGKAVDKLLGNEREFVGERKNLCRTSDRVNSSAFNGISEGGMFRPDRKTFTETKGISPWEGWGSNLKPAHEPICLARKPLAEDTVAENCLKWGTGGLNIDGSRVETSNKAKFPAGVISDTENNYGNGKGMYDDRPRQGDNNPSSRFPANLLHDGSDEVTECFPEDASRFFKSIIYTAKASKSDRGEGNLHNTVKPVAVMEYLINMITRLGYVVVDPFMGSGTTAVACVHLGRKFIGFEIDPGYFEIACKRVTESQKQLRLEI